MSKCKVCGLPDDVRQSLNNMAMEGMSYENISKWLKNTHEIIITAVSIMRHCKSHLEGFTPRSELEEIVSNNPSKPQIVRVEASEGFEIDPTDIIDQLLIDPSDTPEKISRVFLQEILRNQFVIVIAKQQRHIAGKGIFPKDELNTLFRLLDVSGLSDRELLKTTTIAEIMKG